MELEAVERLAGWQPRFRQMTLDASCGPFGDLELGECCEEAGGRPAFLVSLGSEILPEAADRGQSQLLQQQRQPMGVNGDLAHAETSPAGRASSAS